MLSSEARTAYREWRGEASVEGSCCVEDSCNVDSLNSACDAAISSLGLTPTFEDWFQTGPMAKSQSLFYGESPNPSVCL